MAMLKVVFVGHRDLYYGAESVMFRVIGLLKEKAFVEPQVILPRTVDHDFSRQCNSAGIKFRRVRYKLIGGSLFRCLLCLLYNLPALLKLYFYYRKHKVDKVYTNTIVNIIGPLLSLLLRKPHIWHFHEQPTAGAFKWIPLGLYPLYRMLIRRKNNTIVFISKTQKLLWEKEFGMKINNSSIIYTPAQKMSLSIPKEFSFNEQSAKEDSAVYPDDTRILPEKGVVTFGFLGSFTSSKNLLSLLDAFALLQSKHPESNTRLLMMGTGELEGQIISQIDVSGLQNKVTLMPHATSLLPFYTKIDVFVLPSWFESWGLAALEAIQYRKALILTSNSALTEILKPGVDCIYTDPREEGGLYRAMERLLLHPDDRIKMANNACRTLEKLNLDIQFEGSIVSLFKPHEVP